MEEKIIITQSKFKDGVLYSARNLFKKLSDGQYLYRIRAVNRHKGMVYSMFQRDKAQIKLFEPQITLIISNVEQKQFSKSGLCWDVKNANNDTINKIKEIESKQERLRKELNNYLAEKWHELKPLKLEDTLPLQKDIEHFNKVVRQLKGKDKSCS